MFLGIDQSLNATGLCLVDADGRPTHGETVTPAPRKGAERLAYVKACAMRCLARGVKFVALEGYAYNSVGRVFELGEVGGVLRLLVFEHGLAYVIVAPASLKKFATGNPEAEKTEMVAAAVRVGFAAEDDNQADAFFLAQIARAHHLGLTPNVRAQLEVLHSLRNPKKKPAARRVRRTVRNAI